MNVSGGTIEVSDGFSGTIGVDGILNISGGSIPEPFEGFPGTFYGGTTGPFRVGSNGEINLFVTQAFIDDVEIDDLLPDVARTIADRDVILSGVLADGSDFSLLLGGFSFPAAAPQPLFQQGSTVTVTLVSADPDILLGDVNHDNAVNFLDISPFIDVLASGGFVEEADVNQDGEVNFLDISRFIEILSGG